MRNIGRNSFQMVVHFLCRKKYEKGENSIKMATSNTLCGCKINREPKMSWSFFRYLLHIHNSPQTGAIHNLDANSFRYHYMGEERSIRKRAALLLWSSRLANPETFARLFIFLCFLLVFIISTASDAGAAYDATNVAAHIRCTGADRLLWV